MGETKESHEERTAHEPREAALHSVILNKITLVGSLVRILQLKIPDGAPDIHFLAGQWLDTFCPGIAKAGGFTITSAPSKAKTSDKAVDRYIELAIKKSPENPAAAWLWQDPNVILGQTLRIRVGGSFVFPPPGAPPSFVKDRTARIVFVAGGVGINPLISMASHLGDLNKAAAAKNSDDGEGGGAGGPEVIFLYSVQADPQDTSSTDDESDADRIPFLQRLASLFSRGEIRGQLKVFLTGSGAEDSSDGVISCNEEDVPSLRRRITTSDLDKAILGDRDSAQGLDSVYVYVCGVPTMTDVFVEYLTRKDGPGLDLNHVLCEKWW